MWLSSAVSSSFGSDLPFEEGTNDWNHHRGRRVETVQGHRFCVSTHTTEDWLNSKKVEKKKKRVNGGTKKETRPYTSSIGTRTHATEVY